MNNKTNLEKMVLLTDNVAQLDNIIQKLDLLSEDFCYNYLGHLDMFSETAEADLKLVKTMAEVIRDYSSNASQISAKLPDISESLLENIRCE